MIVVQYKPVAKHVNADDLSRLPLNVTDQDARTQMLYTQLKSNSYVYCLLFQACDIQRATMQDPVQSQVYSYTLNGWPNHYQTRLNHFHHKI